jgi:hypothetical protein
VAAGVLAAVAGPVAGPVLVVGPGQVVLVKEDGPGAGKAAPETAKEAVVAVVAMVRAVEAMAKVVEGMVKVVEVMAVPEASQERVEFPELAVKQAAEANKTFNLGRRRFSTV